MTTLAESLISSTSRPLTLRMRPDLTARRHRYHGRTFWVVKEPVGLNYFRFHDEEYAILCMLDGRSSLDEIKEQFEHAVHAAKDHLSRPAAVRGHAAPQRPGDQRGDRPGAPAPSSAATRRSGAS